MCVLANNKAELHKLLEDVRAYLWNNLKLKIKSNYQIFPIDKRGIDFVGYIHYKEYTLLRKIIKQKFKRMIRYNKNRKSTVSYNGWLSHCNSYNLRKKYLS